MTPKPIRMEIRGGKKKNWIPMTGDNTAGGPQRKFQGGGITRKCNQTFSQGIHWKNAKEENTDQKNSVEI